MLRAYSCDRVSPFWVCTILAACSPSSSVSSEPSTEPTSEPTTPTSEPTTAPTTAPTSGVAGTTTSAPTGTTAELPTTTGTPSDLPPAGGECDLFAQDCSSDQKCNAWNDGEGFFPNGAKCVPTGKNLPGEPCTTEGGFGSGIDDCVAGSICLDLDDSGMASCVAYCSGSEAAPTCPNVTDQCSFLFEPIIPLCFPSCDPLVQDCPTADTCVPNIAALGAPYFVCMPRVFQELDGQYGSACYALSGCDPSYICVFAENLPTCDGITYCCSSYCDLKSPDTCKQFDPLLTCIPWFADDNATPGYEDVGVCGIMP